MYKYDRIESFIDILLQILDQKRGNLMISEIYINSCPPNHDLARQFLRVHRFQEILKLSMDYHQILSLSGPGLSKLMTSLVNVS